MSPESVSFRQLFQRDKEWLSRVHQSFDQLLPPSDDPDLVARKQADEQRESRRQKLLKEFGEALQSGQVIIPEQFVQEHLNPPAEEEQ